MDKVNPKFEIRSAPQDTLWWKQYQNSNVQMTKMFGVFWIFVTPVRKACVTAFEFVLDSRRAALVAAGRYSIFGFEKFVKRTAKK